MSLLSPATMKRRRPSLAIVACNLLAALLIAAMSGCATPGPAGGQPEQQAIEAAASGEHQVAAAQYITLAREAAGAERDRYTLLAVEQWLEAGDGRRARTALRSVARPADGELAWLWTMNAAALALWEGEPDDALRLLEPLSRQALPLRYRSRSEALRADAWFQKDDPVRAVELYIQREAWLDGADEIEANARRLWAGLLVSDARTLRAAADRVHNPVVKGWLELGALATSTGRQGIGWANGVARWADDYDEHPAHSVLDELQVADRGSLELPSQIALLLPLSGDNAGAGEAIRNGFLGAYFAASADFNDEQQVRVYDAAGAGGATAAYRRAVEDGAEFVVGPLLRSSVAELVTAEALPVPVLTLNYLPDEITAPPGLYQFALSPEDEAVSAAQRAIADGYSRAVALIPNNDWGRRVLSSFATAFENEGGLLLAYRSYSPQDQDFSIEIEGLLELTDSVQRYRRLRANIGQPLQFDPRRRQDAEFVFLAADPGAGRLLKSQLKFHYAGELPVYSTSFIYAMDGRPDSDLNGIMFADTPWVVSPHAWFAELPALYNRFWPGDRRLGRLHAMGYDAYHLISELFNARTGPVPEFAGATGRLYLDDEGRVHRRLAWAKFVRGEPVAMRPAPELEPERLQEDAAGFPP
ncbi:MAG TPA: penicillin-binding protein activator [Woeseiaceae bacterium]|nr:penicillin-binding protein activator [Woeseiaceae bacterium]